MKFQPATRLTIVFFLTLVAIMTTVAPATAATPGSHEGIKDRDISDRDGDGKTGEETAIKERIKAYIELHGQDGRLTSRQMLDRARFSYTQWLADGRHIGAKGLEGEGFVNIGPINGAGRVSAIAPHPTIEGLVLQGAASGGVWKTLDDGLTWYPTTDGLSDLSVGAVAWAPGSPEVVYLGTGEGDTMIAGGTGYIPGIGLLRSDDAGETWTFPTGDEDPITDLFFDLDVDPENDEIVFAATDSGLLVTEDGGVTWQTLIPSVGGSYAITEIERSKSNADLLYAGQWCEGSCPAGTGRVMRSEDRGMTWLPVGGEGLPGLAGYTNRAALAVAPSNDQILYFATNTDRGVGDETPTSGIFRSDDGGETWVETALSTTNLANNYLGNQGWYDTTIIVSPTDPNIVNAAGVWYVRTEDGGETWVSKYSYSQGGGMGSDSVPHVDVHDFQYQGNTLWVGNDGGVWRSETDGASWNGRNHGVVTRQYYGMDIDPVNRERVIGGTQDNGTNLRRDAGDDNFDLVLGGDGFECAINPMMPQIMYGSIYYTAVYRTSANSGSFSNISPDYGGENAPFITPLILHPTNPNVVLTGAERLWRSDNGGDNWYGLPKDTVNDVTGFPWVTGKVWAIAATPADPDRIMMSKGGVIYTSKDEGRTWYASIVSQDAFNLDMSPHDPDLALAAMEYSGTGRGVRRSTDGGTTWSDSGTGLPPFNTQVVRFDPIDANVAYAGTDVGLYRSTDQGVTWTRWGDGLPAVSIHDMRMLPDGSMMRIGTYGRGFWELAIDRPENVRPEIQITDPSASTVPVDAGTPLNLKATATDADGNQLQVDWYLTTDYQVFHQDQGTGSISSDFSYVIPGGGMYQLVARATDEHGEQDIDFFTLFAQEPADSCDTPRIIPGDGPFPTTIATSNQFASKSATDPQLPCVDLDSSHPDAGREASLWFEFTPAVSGTYSISTCGSTSDTMLSVWTGDACGTYTAVPGGCNDDDESEHCYGGRTDSYLELDLEGQTTYRVMVGAWRSLDGSIYKGQIAFSIDCLECSAPADDVETMVAAAAHADGLNNTTWVTDLDLHNPGATEVTAHLSFLPAGTDNSGAPSFPASIPAGQSMTFADVVGDFLGTQGSGAIRITAPEGLVVASRTYNTSDDGTFGQFIPGASSDQALDPGEQLRLNGLSGNPSFRTNLGFANASGSPATLSVDLVGSDGSIIGHVDPTLQPWGWLQLNKVFKTAGTGNVEAASAVVDNVSATAKVHVYASVVDATTGDPTYVTETPPGSDGNELWIAASAHANGVGQSVWRTDLWLSNTTQTDVLATIDLLERDQGNSTPASSEITIPAGENLQLADILDSTFNFTGTAALRIGLDGSATATSRTFNQAEAGTFGQFIPGLTTAASVAQGDTGLLTQLRNSSLFRTNVGFVNLGAGSITIHAEYFSSNGSLIAEKDYFLDPFEYFQDGAALPENAAVEGGFAHLTTSASGGRFLAYASVVDNGSDDPIFMPVQKLTD